MHLLRQPRLTWIARLALGIALFGQFAIAAQACLSPQRSMASAPIVASQISQDELPPCSGTTCAGLMPDTEVCLTDVPPGKQVSGLPINSVMPSIDRWSGFTLAPQQAFVPLALSKLDIVTGSGGSRLSILFCSFQT